MQSIFFLTANHFFSYFSTFFIAMLPFIETKGAIPIGMGLGLSPLTSFCFSFLGSLIPVPFLLNLMAPIMEYINKNPKWEKLSKKMNNFIHKNTMKIKANLGSDKPIKTFAVFMFVALPVPGTGVWSGSIIASALNLKKTHSFIAIALGNFFASSLIFLATFGFFVT